jgi:hypothetical protein
MFEFGIMSWCCIYTLMCFVCLPREGGNNCTAHINVAVEMAQGRQQLLEVIYASL